MVNGEEKTRLQVVTESAEKLIESLLNSGESIYVGIVFFSGESYRPCALTKDINKLKKSLDIINNKEMAWVCNTDIVSALTKAEDSFVNNTEDSNRYIILLSDGIPTRLGDERVYSNDTDEVAYDKIKKFAQGTKQKAKEITTVDKSKEKWGIKLISLFIKSDEEEENNLVKDIFEPTSTKFMSIEEDGNGNKIVQAITEELNRYLKETREESEYTETITTVWNGLENKSRRNAVDGNFKNKIFYNNVDAENAVKTELFRQIEDCNDDEKAKRLSEMTWMLVDGGKYQIEQNPYDDGYEEEKKENGKVVEIITHRNATYASQNLVLCRYPAGSFHIDVVATGLKIVLSNGSNLTEQTVTPESQMPLQQSIDAEISHGATVYVEYTIQIRNNSALQCNYLEIIDYLPVDYKFSQEQKLLTSNITNKDYGWTGASLEDLCQKGYITQKAKEEYANQDAVILKLDNSGKGKDGFYITPGGSYEAKIVVSTIMSTINNFSTNSKNAVEILGYKNIANRRMMSSPDTTSSNYRGIYPGDKQDDDWKENPNNVAILPPTGNKYIYMSHMALIVNTSIIAFIMLVKSKIFKK